jgi:hypothetical protein
MTEPALLVTERLARARLNTLVIYSSHHTIHEFGGCEKAFLLLLFFLLMGGVARKKNEKEEDSQNEKARMDATQ